MNSIDPTSQLVAIIRQQVSGARQESIARRTTSSVARTIRKKPAQNLAELVAQRVRSIDREDPERNRKAFKAFLESVLLGELGMDLINDPAFYRLVDEVQRTMAGDETLSALMDDAGRMLLAPRPDSEKNKS